jgi:hypothetical protein
MTSSTRCSEQSAILWRRPAVPQTALVTANRLQLPRDGRAPGDSGCC